MVPDLCTETIGFLRETITFLSSDPLFSIIITLYTLVLLYFPRSFLNLIFSPIIITTFLLLSTLLRLGSNQKQQILDDTLQPENGSDHKQLHFSESIDEWSRNVRAPLQVIYEEVEGDEENNTNEKQQNQALGTDELVSLSLYYPESDDSDSSSDDDFTRTEGWNSPKDMCFRWEEDGDDDRDELIEITLDGKRCLDFSVEEENFIEIDISSTGAPVDI
ncbi:hypothetical protein ACHQM5_022643 [Ranunculus cassubicifolius]